MADDPFMANDPVGRVFLLVAVVVFVVLSIWPNWSIKVLSYGRYGVQDVNSSLLFAVRIIAGLSALVAGGCLVVPYVLKWIGPLQ